MANTLELHRGAVNPARTNITGEPTVLRMRLWRGAVEPSQPAYGSVTAKITGDSAASTDLPLPGAFSIDLAVTGRPQEYELP